MAGILPAIFCGVMLLLTININQTNLNFYRRVKGCALNPVFAVEIVVRGFKLNTG